MHCCILFVAAFKILGGGIDGAEVAEDGGLLLEGLGDGGLAAPPDLEILQHPQLLRLVHLVRKIIQRERGGGGGLCGFSGDDALDLVDPSDATEVGRGGDGAGVRIAEEEAPVESPEGYIGHCPMEMETGCC